MITGARHRSPKARRGLFSCTLPHHYNYVRFINLASLLSVLLNSHKQRVKKYEWMYRNGPTMFVGTSSEALQAQARQTVIITMPPPLPSYNNHVTEVSSQPGPGISYQQNTGQDYETKGQKLKYGEKSVVEAYLLAFSPLGFLGAHHFYLRRYGWGVVYFFTLGLAGCGYLIDLFRIPCLVKQANEAKRNPSKQHKTVSDAYTLWFPMGLLGFHHYYLGNYAWGMLYTVTLGLFGIGWLVDAFRIPSLVRRANERQSLTTIQEKDVCLAVTLSISPFGALGAHHYYLNRPVWGLVYTFTLGLCGVGWIADWFRTPILIKRCNKAIADGWSDRLKTLDDAYILWFPFGILGFHHFYLGRPGWGTLYFFTLGIVGLGWLVDVCRIPSLVKEANLKIKAEQEQRRLVSGSTSFTNQTSVITAGPYAVQGYTNYSVITPATQVTPNPNTNDILHRAYGYSYQQEIPGGPQTLQQEPGQQFVPTPGTYYAPFYNGSMPGYPPVYTSGLAPPPYQPTAPNEVNQQDDNFPTKQ